MKSSDSSIWLIMLLFNRHLLAVPRFRLYTYGRLAFSVAGPMAWNSLSNFIRDPTSSTDCFRHVLKTTCSHITSVSSASGAIQIHALTHSLTHCANCISTLSFPTTYQNILLIFIRNLFLSVLYIDLSSEIVFWFCCLVLYVILTLPFMFIISCAFVASNKYYIHMYKPSESCNDCCLLLMYSSRHPMQ